MGTVGGATLDIDMSFSDALPDTELALAHHKPGGGLSSNWSRQQARESDRAGCRLEKIGDPKPIYMRDGAVLKVGDTWFVGDRASFDPDAHSMSLSVDEDFIDLLQNTRRFEIWWRGERRLDVTIVPEKVSPERFSLGCLPLSESMRKQMQGEGDTMKKLAASPTPRFMGYIGVGEKRLAGNPFSYDDKAAGSASFRLTVGRDGLVKQCDLTGHQGDVRTRQGACERPRDYGRFYPATDASGAPIEAQTGFDLQWNARN